MTKPTIAIVGASSDPSKFGHKAVKAYLQQGYDVYPINPKGGEIAGCTVYTSLADIPVVIFSTSDSPDDIQKSYELNANSYICKPDDLSQLERILSTLYRYWFGHSLSPAQEPAS